VITRGPKPVAVLRELQIPIWANAPEPNTWRELMAVLDEHDRDWPLAGKRVAVQEYGVSNVELLEALRAKGADVTAIQAYQWALPEDVAPLEEAARAVARGDVDVLVVTSGIQFEHFWREFSVHRPEGTVARFVLPGALASHQQAPHRVAGVVKGDAFVNLMKEIF